MLILKTELVYLKTVTNHIFGDENDKWHLKQSSINHSQKNLLMQLLVFEHVLRLLTFSEHESQFRVEHWNLNRQETDTLHIFNALTNTTKHDWYQHFYNSQWTCSWKCFALFTLLHELAHSGTKLCEVTLLCVSAKTQIVRIIEKWREGDSAYLCVFLEVYVKITLFSDLYVPK